MWETVKTIRIDRDITTEEAEDYGYDVASDLGIRDAHVEVKVEGEEYILELQEYFEEEESEEYDNDSDEERYAQAEEASRVRTERY